ncbi:MAG: cytidine deaminase, partial [Lachnospiraceae bacterium]|nr:cytidine deaminase [Lachnospiraceae bacterium]
AVFKAVSEGVRRILKIAVIGGAEEEKDTMSGEAAPCGICRQVLREFSLPESLDVIIAKSINDYRNISLSALLPDSFGLENLTAG